MRIFSTTCLFLSCSLASIFLADPNKAFAEEQLTIKVVDIQKVISESVAGKAARNAIEGEAKKNQSKLETLRVEAERARADLEKQSSLLSGSALEERRDSVQKKEVDFQRAMQDAREQLMKRNDQEIGKVVQEIEVLVKELAAVRKYTFVLERDGQSIIYAGEKIDISEDVIKALDKKHVAF